MGGVVTVMVSRPLTSPTVAVMMAVPPVTAVTIPSLETVATSGDSLAQVNVSPPMGGARRIQGLGTHLHGLVRGDGGIRGRETTSATGGGSGSGA